MIVRELIEQLGRLNPEAEVKVEFPRTPGRPRDRSFAPASAARKIDGQYNSSDPTVAISCYEVP